MLGNLFRRTTNIINVQIRNGIFLSLVNKKQNVEIVIPAPGGGLEIFSFPWPPLGAKM